MTAKYFVWGSGAWRELDLSSGCVSGWRRRARFVFVRRGRLQLAPRRAVLRALSALAAGRPGAAADGPRLSQLRTSPVSGNKPRQRAGPGHAAPPCHVHACCGTHYNGRVDNNDVRPAPPAPPAPTAARREAATQCGSLTINIPAAPPAPAPAPAPAPPSSSDEFVSAPAKRRLVNKVRDTLPEVTALLASKPPAPRAAPPPPRPPSTDTESSDYNRPLAQRAGAGKAGGGGGAVKELVISDSDVAALRGFVARTRPSALARFDADGAYKCALFYAINPLVELRRCARLERLLRERRASALPHFAARLGLTPTASTASPSASPAASPRAVPRRASRRRLPSSDSTDANKENKEQFSTPKKARTEHSAKKTSEATSPSKSVARPARAPPPRAPLRSPPARAAKTILASTSSNPPPRPARSPPPRSPAQAAPGGGGDADVRVTRGSTGTKDTHTKQTGGDGDVTTKRIPDSHVTRLNGHVTDKRGAGDVTTKRKGDSEVTVRRVNGDVTDKRGAGDVTAQQSDSDIEWIDSNKAASVPRAAPARHTHVISKRATSGSQSSRAEYSNLEDHAIVSWVSVGARASLVNGNAVWRDLQDQFVQLAGRSRTWHSLRNRYLRYILPSLGALRLPPAQESRLRAAAATGVTKSRKEEKRRNSIFKEAERGASSLRPRPPPSPPSPAPATTRAAHATVATVKADEQTESRALRRSPRYSEVTRQFAARHAPRPASSAGSSPARSPSPAPARPASPRAARSRRLYNPNRNV